MGDAEPLRRRGGGAPAGLGALDAARAAAQRAAAARAHTELSLRRRLEQRGFSPAEARIAAAEAAAGGWVDDRAVAGPLAERLLRRGTGAARIGAELRARGVAEGTIAEALAPIGVEEELRGALAAARRHMDGLGRRAGDDPERRAARVAAALARRGFSASAIRAAVAQVGLPAPAVD